MVLWYITFVPVVKTALSVALCVDVYDAMRLAEIEVTHKYWTVDTSLECYDGPHLILFYVLVVAFVCPVYGGLLILFIVFITIPVEHLIQETHWAYQTTGFLYRCYRMDHRRYWEVAVIVRKTAIAVLVACARAFDDVLSITGIGFFLTLAIVAQILAMPYRKRFHDLNKIEVTSLATSLMTMQGAITLRDMSYAEDATRQLLTVACLLLNVITFFVFVFYVLKFAAEYLKHVLREKGEHFASDAGMFRILAHWFSSEVKRLIGKMRPTSEYAEIAELSAVEA